MSTVPKLPFYPPLPESGEVPLPGEKQRELDRVFYPESDGKPIAESTLQFLWIEIIKGGLESLFADDPDVFVAADLLWYPVEGEPGIVTAPDSLVVLGRPKGHRGSYLQWRENNMPPQIVFEVWSPGNTLQEMDDKLRWYERYGVLEYYEYDPVHHLLRGYYRRSPRQQFAPIPTMAGWVSPLIGVRFDQSATGELQIFRLDGRPFVSYVELDRLRQAEERQRLIAEELREAAEESLAESERAREQAEQERRDAEEARQDAEEKAMRLAERLRALGIDPEEG
jgi:Uma2 family endonuclease